MAYKIELNYQVSEINPKKGPTYMFPSVSWRPRKPVGVAYGVVQDRYWTDPFKTIHVYEIWLASRPDDDWIKEVYERYKWIHLEALNETLKYTVTKELEIIRSEKPGEGDDV